MVFLFSVVSVFKPYLYIYLEISKESEWVLLVGTAESHTHEIGLLLGLVLHVGVLEEVLNSFVLDNLFVESGNSSFDIDLTAELVEEGLRNATSRLGGRAALLLGSTFRGALLVVVEGDGTSSNQTTDG